MVSKEPRFLDETVDMTGNRVTFTSFPRSGNSFLRKIIEQVTGVHTGGDIPVAEGLPLQQQGMIGTIFGNNQIWVTKTHYPWVKQPNIFTAEKVICIARNPIDNIPSLTSMSYTQSHSVEPNRPWNTFAHWPTIVPYFLGIWRNYHDRVIAQAKSTPTFFLTYEELIVNPVPLIEDLFKFMFGVDNIKGTFLEQRIFEVVGKGHQVNQVYTLKAGAGKLYRQLG